jgi:hypothetical protein
MATNESELIEEVRALTGYDQSIMTDATMQELVNIGKEELGREFSEDFPGFFGGNTDADRALFWFTCIAAKVRAGEIAGVNISVGSIRATSYSNSKYAFWFDNFQKRMESAYGGKPVNLQSLERDNRSYGDNA